MENIKEKINSILYKYFIEEDMNRNLFVIDTDSKEIAVRFLNKEHYDLIMKVAKRDLFKEFGHSVKFSHFNLRAVPLTILESEKTNSENRGEGENKDRKVEKGKLIKELSIEQLDIINRINEFIDDETDKLFKELDTIREEDENYLDNTLYSSNFGRIEMAVKIWNLLNEMRGDLKEE